MKFILPFGYAVYLINFFYSLEISEGLGLQSFLRSGILRAGVWQNLVYIHSPFHKLALDTLA